MKLKERKRQIFRYAFRIPLEIAKQVAEWDTKRVLFEFDDWTATSQRRMIMSYKGYVDKEKRKQYKKGYMREYRANHKGDEQRKRNRLGFLELEVERLQKCLLHKVSVPALEHNYDNYTNNN